MAAPTSVSLESNSITTATLRWVYAGTNSVSIYRSTDGVSYSLLDTISSSTTSYIDSGLTPGTQYWYKLSDDVGATFSSVVTVVVQSCLPPSGSNDTFSLPRLSENHGDPADEFNNLAERIEAVLGGRVLSPNECVACPTNGAIILDCSGHCKEWLVIVDEDINSISMQFCDEGDGNIDFVIPPNTTRTIKGWPNGFGASGNEPAVSGGTNGRTMSVPSSKTGKAKATASRRGTGTGLGPGGGTGAGSCNCSPVGGNLLSRAAMLTTHLTVSPQKNCS